MKFKIIWTKTNEKLPPQRKSVLICTNFGNKQVARLIKDDLWDAPYSLLRGEFIKYWMFLPASPDEQ